MINKKRFLINVVVNSEHIKNNTTFTEQLRMIKWVKGLKNTQIDMIFEDKIDNVRIPKPSNAAKSVLKLGFAVSTVVIPGGFALRQAVKYAKDSFNYKCELKCKKSGSANRSLCHKKCIVSSLDSIVKILESQVSKCDTTKNSKKCRKKLYSVIKEYKIKQARAQSKLSLAKRKASIRGY